MGPSIAFHFQVSRGCLGVHFPKDGGIWSRSFKTQSLPEESEYGSVERFYCPCLSFAAPSEPHLVSVREDWVDYRPYVAGRGAGWEFSGLFGDVKESVGGSYGLAGSNCGVLLEEVTAVFEYGSEVCDLGGAFYDPAP